MCESIAVQRRLVPDRREFTPGRMQTYNTIVLGEIMMAMSRANSLPVNKPMLVDKSMLANLPEQLVTRGYDIHLISLTEHKRQCDGIHC